MILISNIGNRDVYYDNKPLDRNNVRQKGEEILNNFDMEKSHLSYPLIEPFITEIKGKYKNIYLFVTNQKEGKERRNSDTIHFGDIIKKWIRETHNINVNVVQYVFNPTNYEQIYHFFTSYFTEDGKIFNKADKRIISLSGGTPQMNGALYVILSSIYPRNNEFYSVFNEKLIPINHETTINKIFIKKSCDELLKIYQYQSIITILNEYNVQGRDQLISLLNYAKFRKNFNFDKAREYLSNFLKLLPSSEQKEFDSLTLDAKLNPINLIKELFWNIEICYKNQNYLLLVALLFRLEEASIFEIVNYLYKDFFSTTANNRDLNNKRTHKNFVEYLEKKEADLWNTLQTIKIKGIKLNINPNELNRTVLFYIAYSKIDELKKQEIRDIYKINNMLEIFDKINKYCYDGISDEDRKQKYNKDGTGTKGTKCLGDLRNKSIIGHGFEPVPKDEIKKLYGEELDSFILNLKKHLTNLLRYLLNNDNLTLDNIFEVINNKLLNFLLKL